VVNQTYTDFEYIIIDGASTDDSVDIIKEYADKIDYWVSEPDKGIYNAMNKGILKAKGEYLLMLNSGDWLVEDILTDVFSQNYSQDLLYGNIIWTINQKKAFTTEFKDNLFFKTFVNSSIAHQATFIKRELHNKVGLYIEELKIVSDWCFFLLALFKHNCTTIHINNYICFSERDGVSCLPQNQSLIDEERRSFLIQKFKLQYEEYLENIKIEKDLIEYRAFYEKCFTTKLKRFLKKNKLVRLLIKKF